MEDDGILDNDHIIIKKEHVASHGDTVVASINNEFTLKRYYLNDHKVELHPRNDKYDIIYIAPNDEFKIWGIVVRVFRNY